MKVLILLTLVSTVVFNQKDIIEERRSQITELEKTLEFDTKIEYSFEHLEGETSYFTNEDSSKKKIFMIWDHGSYGNTEKEYYTINGKLIYFRNLEHGWIDSNRYSLSETIYYFSDDKLGLKTFHEIETFGEDMKDKDLKILENLKKDTSDIDASDYKRILDGLSHFEAKQLYKE